MDERALCQRFAPRIRLYGLKHLRSEDAAAELVQRVLVAVIEALRAGRVDDLDHLDRYVLGTCRNLAHRLRAADRRAEPTDHEILAELVSELPRLDALDLPRLLDCMRTLETRAASVLHLTFYRDKSADEIARALAMTPANVRVVRHRAVASLRDCMEGA